ncbi:MAG: hypothetical protein HW388_1659 [Dehalococcoidia bacterium]|nr:hypothetical protein [Dehalococcoidia bacterium]
MTNEEGPRLGLKGGGPSSSVWVSHVKGGILAGAPGGMPLAHQTLPDRR